MGMSLRIGMDMSLGSSIAIALGGGGPPLGAETALFYDFAAKRSLIDEISGIPLTFTHTSPSWFFNSAGLLEEVAANEARFDYDPITGISLGLLFEEARTNRALWSRNLAQGAWAKNNIVASQDQVGITGVSNSATRLTATAANATVLQTLTAAATNRAFSPFIRRVVGSGPIQITQDGGASWNPVAVTNGWQRFTTVDNILDPEFGIRITTSGDEIAVDVVQLEDGAVATSPILTAATVITRETDFCFTNNVSWYNALAGTMYARVRLVDPGSTNQIATIHSGSTANQMYFRPGTGSSTNNIMFSGSAIQMNDVASGGIWSPTVFSKIAMAASLNDGIAAMNGSLSSGDNALIMPVGMTQLLFANNTLLAQPASFWLAEYAYANVRKDNAFLVDVTT